MKNIWIIAKRDLRSYFTTPIAYIVIAGFLGIMGWMFNFILLNFDQQNMQYQQYGRSALSITDGILRPVYGNMNVILLFVAPFLTMRLFAEEKKQHTLELLMTSPVTLLEIVLGKFLSALLLVMIILAMTAMYPIALFATGNPELGPILTSYLGILLLSSCYLAIGMFFSAMTENQIVAVFSSFAVLLFFWLISWASQSAGPVWGDVLNYLSLITHFNNFSQGILTTTDVVYYLSFAGMGIFLTHRVLDSYRWR